MSESTRTDAAALSAKLRAWETEYGLGGREPEMLREAADTIDRLTEALAVCKAALAEESTYARGYLAQIDRLTRELAVYTAHDVVCNSDRHTPPSCSCLGRARRERDTLRRALDDHAAGWRRTASGVRDGEARRWLRACADDIEATLAEPREPEAARTEPT